MPEADFADLLRGQLTENQLSQRKLASQVPIDAGQLSRILNGIRPATATLAERCDQIFGTGDLFARAVQRRQAVGLLPPTTGESPATHPNRQAGTTRATLDDWPWPD